MVLCYIFVHYYNYERGVLMAVSKAHIKASNKYNKANYKQLKANVKPDDYDLIDNYCKEKKISKAKFIVEACKFFIDNHDDK